MRGGSWLNGASDARSAYREDAVAADRIDLRAFSGRPLNPTVPLIGFDVHFRDNQQFRARRDSRYILPGELDLTTRAI